MYNYQHLDDKNSNFKVNHRINSATMATQTKKFRGTKNGKYY